jgi:hypothetical protein
MSSNNYAVFGEKFSLEGGPSFALGQRGPMVGSHL